MPGWFGKSGAASAERLVDEAMERFVNLDFDGALELLESAERADPENVAVQVRFIAIYAVKGDNASAKIHYERLKEIDPAAAATALANDVPEALQAYLEE